MVRHFLIVALCAGLLFAACSRNNVAGSTETTNNRVGLYGKLVDREGRPVADASVKAIDARGVQLGKTAVYAAVNASDTDSVFTDDNGYYSFASLDEGTYNLLGDYDKGKLMVLITGIEYDSTGKVQEVATDTMRAPGRIAGLVITGTNDDGGVLCYVPGTSFLAMTDDTGGFVLANIPQGTYRVSYRKNELKTAGDTGVEVRSGATTILPPKHMEADPEYLPPIPGGLSVVYDTLHGCAVLTWKPVDVSDLAGYIIYRNDADGSVPQQINRTLRLDTTYVDTVFSNLQDTANLVLFYRLKAQDEDANVSSGYSNTIRINAISPVKVKTLISLRTVNTRGDTASVGDTVSVIATWNNATRKNVRFEWFESDDTPVKTVSDTAYSGCDTLKRIWEETSVHHLRVAVTDEGDAVWRDSVTVHVVLDVPEVDAGADTSVPVNVPIWFKAAVAQRFGTIVVYRWDFDGNGEWDDSSETIDSTRHTYTRKGEYTVRLYVRDDDGNEAADTLKLWAGNQPPIITSIRSDTTVSINDSIELSGSATDTDGTIKAYAWDVDGDGDFEYTSTESITTGHRYGDDGIYNAVLRITDNCNNTIMDTAIISVMRDVPEVTILTDTIVYPNDTVHLHGEAMQRFGDITGWQWRIGNGGWNESMTPDTFFIMPQTASILCSLAVIDDDGNTDTGEVRIRCRAKIDMVVVSDQFCLMLDTSGTVWAYGENNYGQLGDGTTTDRLTPVPVMDNVKSIAAGSEHSLFLKMDGTVWACGENRLAQLGIEATDVTISVPKQVMTGVKGVYGKEYYSLFLKTDGSLWICGLLSQNDGARWATPVRMMDDVLDVGTGDFRLLILKTDHTLWAYGLVAYGPTGEYTGYFCADPQQVMTDVKNISIGYDHCLIIKTDNSLWSFGKNATGQLGDGTTGERLFPMRIMTDVSFVFAYGQYSMIITTDNTLWGFGRNNYNQIIGSSKMTNATPIPIMTEVRYVSGEEEYVMAVKTDGSLWKWGTDMKIPVPVIWPVRLP